MRRYLLTILGAAVLTACEGRDRGDRADADRRDLSLAPADTAAPINDVPAAADAEPAPTPPPTVTQPPRATTSARRPATTARPAPEPPTLAEGTSFEVGSTVEITSRRNKPGETFTATLAEAVRDARGREVIPAGAEVTLSIVQLAPAENRGDTTGKLELVPVNVRFSGSQYPIAGTVTYAEYSLKGRGVTAGDAAKVGIGAAAGAVAGRVLSGKGKGAVVGGAVGAAAGTAVAVETADRDVVIPVGGKIRLRLTAPFSAS
jgi:hypothetical protein